MTTARDARLQSIGFVRKSSPLLRPRAHSSRQTWSRKPKTRHQSHKTCPALDVPSAFASRSETLALSRGWSKAAFHLQSERQRARDATPRQ